MHIKRSLLILFYTALLILVSSGLISAETMPYKAELKALIDEAIQNNTEIKAYSYNVESFETRPSQVKSLDNPRIGIAISNLPVDTFEFDQEAMTQKQISIKQKLPFPGKRSLKYRIAKKDIAIARNDLTEKSNTIVADVKSAYFDLLFLNKSLDITKRNKELLAGFISSAEARYSVGKSSQSDVVKAQMELSAMIKKILILEQQVKSVESRLSYILNRKDHSTFQLEDIEQTGFNYSSDELMNIALEGPMLERLRNKIEIAGLSKELSKKEYYPDFDISLSYGQRDDTGTLERPDFFSASVTVSVPLWFKSKESKKVAEAKAKEQKVKFAFESMKSNLHSKIRNLTHEIERLDRQIELLKTGLIPQSSLSYESTVAAYKVNKATLLDLIRNQVNLYNLKIEYFQSLYMREKKLAELETAVGVRLFQL